MTEEIKKILKEISNDENYSNFIDSQNGGAEDYLLLEKIEGKQLVNYITNLQKENEKLKEIINDNMTVYLKGLEDGKDKMKEIFESVYKSRNEKAIEYIKENLFEENNGCGCEWQQFPNYEDAKTRLLNTLQGGDE